MQQSNLDNNIINKIPNKIKQYFNLIELNPQVKAKWSCPSPFYICIINAIWLILAVVILVVTFLFKRVI